MTQQGDRLQQADLLRRKGMKQEARNILVGYVQENPDSTRAWWLLSFVLDDPKQQLDCVQRVLKNDPGNIEARSRLLQIQSDLAPKPSYNMEQPPSRLHPITAPFITDEEAAARSSVDPFESSFMDGAYSASSVPAPFLSEDDESQSSSNAFDLSSLRDDDSYRSSSAPAPFLMEDDDPPQFPSSNRYNAQQDEYRSSLPYTFLPEEDDDESTQQPAPSAFERSFVGNETYRSTPDPVAYSYEPESAPQQTPAARPARKKSAALKKADLIKYGALLAIFLCAFIGIIIGFFIVLRGQGVFPVAPTAQLGPVIPTETPTAISTQGLPPTWTPAATNTLFPTSTLAYIESTPTPVLNVIGTNDPNEEVGVGLANGMQAPDFTLKNSNTGNQVSLSDFKGKPVIIFFWVGGCGYCDPEAEAMQDIYAEYKDAGAVVLAVDVWGDSDHARAYRDAHDLTYPMLIDPKGGVFKTYGGTNRFPLNYFVDTNGNVSFNILGMLDYSMLNMNIRRLLNLIPTVSP